MSIRQPEGWQPLPQTYHGEDLLEYYAIMLVDEVSGIICSTVDSFEIPLVANLPDILAQKEVVNNRLREQDIYYHPPDTSVFLDYKLMRQAATIRIGNDHGEFDPDSAARIGFNEIIGSFCADMSTEQALSTARHIVRRWEWSPESTY